MTARAPAKKQQRVKRKASELSPAQKAYLTSPYGFCKEFLGMKIYDRAEPLKVGECVDPVTNEKYYDIIESNKHKQVLDAIGEHGASVSATTCNGMGKTSTIVSGAILWHMACHPNSLTISTAGVSRQVRDQLFPYLQAHERKFQGWEFSNGKLSITAPNGARYIGFVTDDAGKAEGWHGNKNPLYDLKHEGGPLFIIIDEAKSVPDAIFGAADRCTYQRLLYVSSPGFAEGDFYKSQTINAGIFKNFKISAADCPHLDHDKVAKTIRKRGIDHPLIKSSIFAEFMSDADGVVIPLRYVETGMRGDHIVAQSGERVVFCDFAAGGDENVIAERVGNKVRIVDAWREKDTMSACAKFVTIFKREGYSPSEITGDNASLGIPMIDALHKMGWHINRENNGEEAWDPASYFNRGSELWFEGSGMLKRGEIILPNDDELKAQLTSRKQKSNSKGKLQIESKKEMKARGLASPDRADAVLGCMAPPRMATSTNHADEEEDFGNFDEEDIGDLMNELGMSV